MPEHDMYLNMARKRQQRIRRTGRAVAQSVATPAANATAFAYQPRLPSAELSLPYGGATSRPRRLARATTAGSGGAPRGRLLAGPHIRPPADAATDVFLPDEFDRIQREQHVSRARRARGRIRRPWGYVVVGVPVLLLLIAAAILGPILYEGTRAYQDVFVEPVPHDEPHVVAGINDAGTPVLATATAAAQATLPAWDGKERVTILLLGIDQREDEATRSDTMILVNIDPVAKTAGMLSVPRDMQVVIPGYGRDKINAAYAYGDRDDLPGGGPVLTIRTIEANFGIQVDYFAQVDFKGFVTIVDTIGGITLDVPYSIKDDAYPANGNNYMRVYFGAGWQHMDGERALQYARTRHSDTDYARSERQQQVLLALRQQAVNLDLLSNARELITTVGDSVRTDLSLDQVLQLARLASEFSTEDITQYSLDTGLIEQELPGEPYFLVPDWDICGEVLSEFMGQEVEPPASVAADPSLDTPIRVANGTTNAGLAQRVANVLIDNGFTDVTVVDDGSTLPESATRIVDNRNDLATSMYVAGTIGIGVETIDMVAATAETTRAEDGIVVILGDDAPDPAYFSPITVDEPAPAEPVQDIGDGEAGESVGGVRDSEEEIVPVDETGQ
ncbi:MAG: LCP family protein [Thermomicrobiales bacterium]